MIAGFITRRPFVKNIEWGAQVCLDKVSSSVHGFLYKWKSMISLSMQYGRQHLAIQCIIVKQKGVWPNAPRMEALQKISPHMAGSTSTAPIQSPSFSCKGSIIVIYSAFLIFLAKKIPPGQNRGLYIHIFLYMYLPRQWKEVIDRDSLSMSIKAVNYWWNQLLDMI